MACPKKKCSYIFKNGSAKHILIILIPLYCYQNKPTLSSFVTTLLSESDRESRQFYLAYHANKTHLQSHKWCGLIRGLFRYLSGLICIEISRFVILQSLKLISKKVCLRPKQSPLITEALHFHNRSRSRGDESLDFLLPGQ